MIDPRGLHEKFVRSLGRAPRIFHAPGRVNLIGEHTDYNDGFVFPMAIEVGTTVAAARRPDRRVIARSLAQEEVCDIRLDAPAQQRRGHWGAYVEGVIRVLMDRGHSIAGADLLIDSDVPTGAGLSSSAALEISVGCALLTLAEEDIEGVSLAQAAQIAEHEYVGTRCGIMDQLIATLGVEDHALLIDCRSLQTTAIPLRLDNTVVVICDSRVKHALASSEYNQRRAECEEGVRLLSGCLENIGALRDVELADLEAHRHRLPDTTLRRCRHVVSENRRTLAAVDRLRAGDLAGVGSLMVESHESLRDDYDVSCPELDFLVSAAMACPGVLGARMTGGGFGGCTVNLVAADEAERLQASLARDYRSRFGHKPDFHVSRACGGARELELPAK